MANTQHDARMAEDSSTARTEDSRRPEGTTLTAARMLANPRRTRRS
jgi:hypothetical protein